jgi:hypothetical protein
MQPAIPAISTALSAAAPTPREMRDAVVDRPFEMSFMVIPPEYARIIFDQGFSARISGDSGYWGGGGSVPKDTKGRPFLGRP